MDTLIEGEIFLSDIIVTEHLAYTYPGMDNMPGVAVFKDLDLQIHIFKYHNTGLVVHARIGVC